MKKVIMKPEIGTKVYCIYGDGILVDKVAFLGNKSFIVESFGSGTYEDSWEWYYRDYETDWFADLDKAKEELLARFEEEDNLKITKISDDWYQLEEDE